MTARRLAYSYQHSNEIVVFIFKEERKLLPFRVVHWNNLSFGGSNLLRSMVEYIAIYMATASLLEPLKLHSPCQLPLWSPKEQSLYQACRNFFGSIL